MSSTDTSAALPAVIEKKSLPAIRFARTNAPIVPPGSVTGRSLTIVISIMCFMASLTAGGVYLMLQAASLWTNNISSEITVQVMSRDSNTSEDMIVNVTRFLNDQNGIKRVTPFSKDQSLQLVEPWIGKSDVLKTFAIPRLIAVEVDREAPPEIGTLKKVLETKFPGTLLDDHGFWRREIKRLTRLIEIGGITIILLMAAATGAVIIAAARSAIASNREIVEVLNLVGAEEKFIAQQFETHFLKVGVRAGFLGAGLAGLTFFLTPLIAAGIGSTVTSEAEIKRLISASTLDFGGYLLLFTIVMVVAVICKIISRYGVRHILNQQIT